MAHDRRLEGRVIVMAGRTLRRCRNVIGRFAQRRRAVVTGGTITDGAGIVQETGAGPRRVALGDTGRMAGVALCRGGHVGRRLDLSIDAQISAIVASRAIASHYRPRSAGVIHRRRGKGREIGMAGIAGGRRRNMGGRLAESGYAIVACGTSTGADNNTRVREICRLPGCCPMAVVARQGGGNVRRWLGLGIDRDEGSAMAGDTVIGGYRARRPAVTHRCRREGREGVMANVTGSRRRNMRGRFAQALPSRAVVAGCTASVAANHHTGVAEGAGGPGRVVFRNATRVAGIALGRCYDVSARLVLGILRGIGTAVAGRTIAGNQR